MPVRVDHGDEGAHLAVRGDLTRQEAPELYHLIGELSRRRNLRYVRIDLSQLEDADSAGIAALSLGKSMVESQGKSYQLVDLPSDLAEAMRRAGQRPLSQPLREHVGAFERAGERAFRSGAAVVGLADFLWLTCSGAFSALVGRSRLRLGAIVQQAVVVGVDAVGIVALLGTLVGVTLAFQAALQLSKFGAEIYMAELVALGMVREFGSLVTGILIAGRSGAAMSAELGTMKVNEEIDALEAMGIDPVVFLVLPRLIAISLMQPVLSLLAMGFGIGGGVATAQVVAVPPGAVFARMQSELAFSDFVLGVLKSVLFAWIVGLTSCFVGLRTSGGAVGVGRSATRSVVASIVLIIFVDSVVTTLWTLLNG